MKAILSLLKDRRRSQRGSILSGVLIMTAFVAILSGALMTALSTNFLLSNTLLNRVTNEATVNSAIESSLSQMEGTPISSPCPQLQPTTLNNLTAVATYTSCWPTFREKQYPPAAISSSFTVDGSHSVVSRSGQALYDFYLVGSSAGRLYQFNFGNSSPNWSLPLPGGVSGPPLAVSDLGACCSDDIEILAPLSKGSNSPPECSAGGCVASLAEDGTSTPDGLCYMAANGSVSAAPAVGVNNPTVAFFGDSTGSLFAYLATESGNCAAQASTGPVGQPVVSGPVVFAGPTTGSSKSDEIYVLMSDGTSSELVRYVYTVKNGVSTLSEAASLGQLPPNAVGMAVDGNSLPARIAVTYRDGRVSLVQLQTSFLMTLLRSGSIAPGIADSPAWCCGSSPNLIGVAQTHGLYVLDTNLNVVSSFGLGNTTISGSPAGDRGGDWFFGADDGNVYEVPAISSAPTIVSFGSGQLGQIRSSTRLGACGTKICIYFGSANGNAYMIPLDARDAVVTACISNTPPSCSGANPRLQASIEVGASQNPRTVHVQGWSYNSG